MKEKYCSNCGEKLKTELDFFKNLGNVNLLKKCKHCGFIVDTVTMKSTECYSNINPYEEVRLF